MLSDDFERADGEPGAAPTGHLWHNGGTHRGVIDDGRLVKEDIGESNAFYLETIMPQRIRRAASSFSFVGTSGDNCSVVFLLSRDGQKSALGIYKNMVHVVCSATAVNVDYYINGSATTVDSFTHSTPLALDGTVYEWAVRFEGSTVVVEMPDGTEETATHANLDQAGRYIAIECFVFAGQDAEPRFESVEVWT